MVKPLMISFWCTIMIAMLQIFGFSPLGSDKYVADTLEGHLLGVSQTHKSEARGIIT